MVRLPSLVLSKDEIVERALYLADSAGKTHDPVLRQARLDGASELNLEALRRFPPVIPTRKLLLVGDLS